MWNDQGYYYSDSSFQLELNLQCVRRNLVEMLDEFEAVEYDRCFDQAEPALDGLRASNCFDQGPSLTKPTPSQSLSWTTPPQSHIGAIPVRSLTSSGQYTDAVESPPAIDLPHPDLKAGSEPNCPPSNDLESWVETSTPNPDRTVSPGSKFYASNFPWPPPSKSVWKDFKNKINEPEVNTATISQAGSVQDFFRQFNLNSVEAGYNHAQNKALMETLKCMANKNNKPEYTYF